MIRFAPCIALAATVMSAGCASKLIVSSTEGSGIPIHVATPYVVTYRNTMLKAGGKCEPVLMYRHVTLPSRETYYVNVKAAQFGKTALAIETADAGFVKKVDFNSEPKADAITAATNALTSLLPFVGVLPRQAPETEAIAPATPLCDAGEEIVAVTKLTDFPAHPPR